MSECDLWSKGFAYLSQIVANKDALSRDNIEIKLVSYDADLFPKLTLKTIDSSGINKVETFEIDTDEKLRYLVSCLEIILRDKILQEYLDNKDREKLNYLIKRECEIKNGIGNCNNTTNIE